jgi:cysteate synthase
MVVASAGNTARAFLQIASRHGVAVTVVVPESALGSMWLTEEKAPTAQLVVLAGSADYLDVIELAHTICDVEGYYPEGGAKNVARRDGMGCALLAAAEAIGDVPEHYVQAVGSGTGGIAAWEMSLRLNDASGSGRSPMRLHLVQNSPFCIMTDAWNAGSRELPSLDEDEARRGISALHAPVLSNRKPPYGITGGLYDALRSSGGSMYAVANQEAVEAGELFERLEGCDLAPAAEVALAGLISAVETNRIGRGDTIALNVTGGGLKRVEREGLKRQLVPDVVVEPHEATPEHLDRKLVPAIAV